MNQLEHTAGMFNVSVEDFPRKIAIQHLQSYNTYNIEIQEDGVCLSAPRNDSGVHETLYATWEQLKDCYYTKTNEESLACLLNYAMDIANEMGRLSGIREAENEIDNLLRRGKGK